MERAKKLQEQREKEMVEKQKQQEIAAGNFCFLYYGSMAVFIEHLKSSGKVIGRESCVIPSTRQYAVDQYAVNY